VEEGDRERERERWMDGRMEIGSRGNEPWKIASGSERARTR
jgi:hypothetical protein